MNTRRAIHGIKVLLDEAQIALIKININMERCLFMLNNANTMLTNLLKQVSNDKEKSQEKGQEKKGRQKTIPSTESNPKGNAAPDGGA
ncbi:hypothetical protein ES705_10557 [subsurface metagenome]